MCMPWMLDGPHPSAIGDGVLDDVQGLGRVLVIDVVVQQRHVHAPGLLPAVLLSLVVQPAMARSQREHGSPSKVERALASDYDW